ncbi:uncharacterized protein LOC111372001 [Olea europaea var. sylvestris]|uniref:uncharacterized protein LOC111372001 n=1 Tax=Olea europaea var. sylvestris TaxID=158386 RepID=UPI000C1D36F4|nr:uncharacterized protein LOC111372001 [Olea europaea var. sylvestris]
MEVYIDDMMVKSLQATKHRGIEANPVKVMALLEMRSPQKPKEVQRKKFQWTSKCEKAFEALKKHLGKAPLLSKPQPDESLLLYLAVSDVAVSAVLIREENKRQLPVYYISKTLLPAETCYPDMEKLALALITASRKLRPYFQAHSIQVLTNFPLKQVMQKTGASGHLLKWAIELSEFDLTFRPRHAIKVRFDFKASNNAAEYEAFLTGLRLAKEMRFRMLLASSDSQLIVRTDSSLPSRECTCRRPFKIGQQHGFRAAKGHPIEHLSKPSTSGGEEILWIEGTPLWMQPIIAYLKDQTLPASRGEARKLRKRSAHFVLHEDTLYKRGFASPLLRCVGGEEATYILRETHEGICGNHSKGTALAHKPAQNLSVVTSPWPFAKWDIDFIGPLPKGRGSAAFAIVAIDYFTKKLDTSKGAWVDELPRVVWAIRTSCWTATGETPFSMTYGAEAMSPIEVGVPLHQRVHFNEISNDEARINELHLLEERRETSQVNLANFKFPNLLSAGIALVKGGVIHLMLALKVASYSLK